MATDSTTHSALYQTIHSQPAVVAAVLENAREPATRAAAALAAARRIFLVGTGTSSHAAVVGEHLLRAAGADAYASTNFDFVTYPRPIGADDALIAISHRGSKRYGALAIAHARAAGARIVGLTGLSSPMDGPDIVIGTAPQEKSSTHTASYTGNLTALALIATLLGKQRGTDMHELDSALTRLPEAIAALLTREAEIYPVAEALAARGRLVLVGAGPNAVTAREGALKVKESSYLTAEGFELETALHGALQAIEAGDVAIVIATQGAALERTGDTIRALDLIGARLMIVADERTVDQLPAVVGATVVTFAPVPEALSPVLAVVPLQLLADATARLRGTNPDSFRADNPIYKRAIDSYAL